MAYKSITRRWVANSLAMILFVLLIASVATSVMIFHYYYTAVERALDMRAQSSVEKIQEILVRSNAQINQEIRMMVQNFGQKDTIEIMAVGADGQIIVMSSGFSHLPEETMPDFETAKTSENGRGFAVYRMKSTGEKVMALSAMLPVVSTEVAALRYVVSVETIDRTITTIIVVLCGITLIIVAFILITSSYFIRSIVVPVQQVGIVARGFATGDMSARIMKQSNDEIGELCDIINYMADEIQASEKLKHEFISSVSHELRTPLTAIKGWGETLATVGIGDEQLLQKGVHVIVRETERLSNMVEELLDFSQMQSGKFTLVKTKMDVLAELDGALLVYAERARRDHIEFCYVIPDQQAYIFGDKNRIKQIFINIIDNAIKYSESGDRVTVTASDTQDGWMMIRVQDTGCGIDAQDLPKVKDNFYKANASRRGSGIGLAVADELVRMHDGALTIDSHLGVGTTVTIRLPCLAEEEQPVTQITG